MKNKEKINTRIEVLEFELRKLKELNNEPEPRKPEVGDVWTNGTYNFLQLSRRITNLDHETGEVLSGHIDPRDDTYLGKFDEVYVKRDGHVSIADVREALSHKDMGGDSILNRVDGDLDIYVGKSGKLATRGALRNLGIIED